MKLTFDYYRNLEQVDLYLCNPDGKELFSLPGKNRNLTLRFNDLSELTFEVMSRATLSNGTVVDLESYDYIETKRLVYATNIGWFQISRVDERDDGIVKYKTVTAESYQAVLKNKGFLSEERVYCFYNPNDPLDDYYDSTKDDAIPSVLGQWNKQLGIKLDLNQGRKEPDEAYDYWTVTYVNSNLIYNGKGSTCRTFQENVTYGYDWIINDVEEAFSIVVLFDFMYKTIHVLTPSEVTEKANVIYTFSNFMKNVQVTEKSEDIVTVLNCNGDNCDITTVNPTGTNYICDFSYFMDKVNNRWMSPSLIKKLEQWEGECEGRQAMYSEYVSQLRALLLTKTEHATSLQETSLALQDLKNAQNKRSVVGSGTPGALCGIITAETVQAGKKSIKSGTNYYSAAFTGETTVTAYQSAPTYNTATRKWVFSGTSRTAKANSIISDNLSDENTSGNSYWYFSDAMDGSSYCKLQSAVTVDKETATSQYYCGGFDRYIAFTFPESNSAGGMVYTDTLQTWINLRESIVTSLNNALYGYGYETDAPTSSSIVGRINSVKASLDSISSRLNLISYFSNTPDLLRELNCYWIEGDYTNDNIAVLETTTPEEEIDLTKELLETGYQELRKVCQPRFSFSLESIDATKQFEFREQMRSLELGKIVTIEKEEGLWYYPALLEISLNLDNSDEFNMTFANAIRLDDWGYTYSDLIADASSTSRKVSANWQNFLAYAKERDTVNSLIRDPLDMTLRAAFANMVNQEFTVDKNGILGRKKLSENSDEFEDEQVRLINNLLIFTDDNWETAKTALGKIYYKDDNGNTVTSYGLIAETIIGSLIMGEKLNIKNLNSTVEIGANGIVIKKADGTVVFQAKSDGSLLVSNYASQDSVNDLAVDLRACTSSVDTLSNNLGAWALRVAKAETSITQNAKEIELRAYQSTVDELEGRVDSAEASILVQAGQITSKASQTSVDNLSGRVSSAESTLTQQASQISAKVNESYGNSSSSFGWSLTSSGFYVYSNASTVMKVTSSGLEVSGKITANSGSMTNLTIAGRLYFGNNSSYYLDANYNDGSYYIKLPGFQVDEKSGAVATQIQLNAGVIGVWNFGTDYITPGYATFTYNNIQNSQQYVSFTTSTLKTTMNNGGNNTMDTMEKTVPWYDVAGAAKEFANKSDQRLKNNIEELPAQYEVLFDSLIPRRYKYNNGESGRYHTGFIAQEVVASVERSGLTTQDFAAACLEFSSEDRGFWYLRRDEFVALNTWQIQKLKTRVAELEATIARLRED